MNDISIKSKKCRNPSLEQIGSTTERHLLLKKSMEILQCSRLQVLKQFSVYAFMSASLLVCFFMSACNEKEVQEEIERTALLPFFELIKKGNYKEAYEAFVSEKYREHASVEKFVNSYEANIARRGPIESYSITRVMYVTSLFGKNEVVIELSYKFKNEKHTKPILMILRQDEQGHYRIDSAWHNNKYSNPDGLDGPF